MIYVYRGRDVYCIDPIRDYVIITLDYFIFRPYEIKQFNLHIFPFSFPIKLDNHSYSLFRCILYKNCSTDYTNSFPFFLLFLFFIILFSLSISFIVSHNCFTCYSQKTPSNQTLISTLVFFETSKNIFFLTTVQQIYFRERLIHFFFNWLLEEI